MSASALLATLYMRDTSRATSSKIRQSAHSSSNPQVPFLPFTLSPASDHYWQLYIYIIKTQIKCQFWKKLDRYSKFQDTFFLPQLIHLCLLSFLHATHPRRFYYRCYETCHDLLFCHQYTSLRKWSHQSIYKCQNRVSCRP